MDDFKIPSLPSSTLKSENSITEKSEAQTIKTPPISKKPIQDAADAPSCPYKVPPWSGPPPENVKYAFEVLKSGQIIEDVKDLQQQPVWKFGRLPANDVEMAHPTISRFHAILQYRPKAPTKTEEDNEEEVKESPPEGWYLYDLGSTHGTFLNKQRVPARIYIRMRVGHILRLGASTRNYILQGPVDDEEPESELSITELRAQHKEKLAAAAAEAERKEVEAKEKERNEGISWGMTDDADEETDLTHNPFASTNNEELFLDDPKRTLRGYFEREDMPLEYKCDEMSAGSFVCRVELPIYDERGRPLVAEVVHKGRKKECVVQCALEACRILDRHGVLRQSNQEPLKRKQKSNDSDSDNDEFWDRTGDIERKKQRKSHTSESKALSYEDLLKKAEELLQQLQHVDEQIVNYQDKIKRQKASKWASEKEGVDDLDSFMENLSDAATQLDKTEIRKLRMEQQRIKAEQQKIDRLIKIVKPINMPFANALSSAQDSKTVSAKRQLPMIGKRNQFSKFKVIKLVTDTVEATSTHLPSDEEEVEEDHKEAKKVELNENVKDKNKILTCNEEVIEDNSQTNDTNVNVAEVNEKGRIYGPNIVPKCITQIDDSNLQPVEHSKTEKNTEIEMVEADCPPKAADQETTEQTTAKRRHQRQRVRNKRKEIDIDELEAHESSEKYAKWVPPENQSGDGYTKLNEKYGY